MGLGHMFLPSHKHPPACPSAAAAGAVRLPARASARLPLLLGRPVGQRGGGPGGREPRGGGAAAGGGASGAGRQARHQGLLLVRAGAAGGSRAGHTRRAHTRRCRERVGRAGGHRGWGIHGSAARGNSPSRVAGSPPACSPRLMPRTVCPACPAGQGADRGAAAAGCGSCHPGCRGGPLWRLAGHRRLLRTVGLG